MQFCATLLKPTICGRNNARYYIDSLKILQYLPDTLGWKCARHWQPAEEACNYVLPLRVHCESGAYARQACAPALGATGCRSCCKRFQFRSVPLLALSWYSTLSFCESRACVRLVLGLQRLRKPVALSRIYIFAS